MAMVLRSRVTCKHATCNRSFESHDSMKQHFEASHAQPALQHHQDKYACKHCNRFFRQKEGLRDHMRSCHSTTYESQATEIAPPVLRRSQLHVLYPLACNDCGKSNFRTADALHQHQWARPDHIRVSISTNPNHGSCFRTCSQCSLHLPTAEDLEQHFVEQHPISEVLESSETRTWQQVEERFRASWIKPTIKLYDVHRIFKVYNPGWRRRGLEEYRKQIKTEMSNQKLIKEENIELRNKVINDGNELQRYHGTRVKCRLGRPDNGSEPSSLCTDGECSLCRILQTGFKKSKCRVTKFQRFGNGIYCSSASSKASAYVKCSESAQEESSFSCFGCFWDDESTNENYKVMLVCRVIAGRPHHSTHNLQKLKGPPRGFHSVQGDPGEALNYDELVVYDDRAILPAYIILYTSSD